MELLPAGCVDCSDEITEYRFQASGKSWSWVVLSVACPRNGLDM